MRQRHQELVVYRTLGAGKRLLRTTLWCEFALLGLVSGLVAAIGAETALAVLQTKVFDFPGSRTGGCGSRYLCAAPSCCPHAAAGWAHVY
jgi:predicted lysophospholipase L1 biosynthesis ABC-type transport system permease subunit